MKKIAQLFLALVLGAAFLAMPVPASAVGKRGNPNSGFCKSGKHVPDIKKCKENGGKL
jgi:hypothetical protein